jgi:hypothetical protein
MKRPAVLVSIALTLAACGGQVGSMDRVQAGMSREQVLAVIGPPDTVTHAPGAQCAYYSLLKDFWSRVPWSTTDRYFVCYNDGRVATFGKVDAAPSG